MLQLNFNLECRPCRRARPRWRECVSKLVLCNVFYVLKPQIFEALPARVCAAGRCFGRSVSLLFFTLQSTGSLALRAGRMVGEHLLQVWEMSLNLKSMDIAQGFLTWNCTGIWQMVFNDPWRQWTLSTWQGFGQFPFGVGGFPGQGVRVRDFSNCKSSTACHAIQVHLQVEMIGCTSQHLRFFCRMPITSNTCITFLCTIYIWVIPKIVVPQNGWFIMENLLTLMIWGYHYFRKHPYIYWPHFFVCLDFPSQAFPSKVLFFLRNWALLGGTRGFWVVFSRFRVILCRFRCRGCLGSTATLMRRIFCKRINYNGIVMYSP